MNLYCTKKYGLWLVSFALIFLFEQSVLAQNISVLNKASKSPISDVFIFNKSQKITAITDSLGKVNISEFDKRDTLVFTHQSFESFMIPKINIGNSVYLKEKAITIDPFTIVGEHDKDKAISATTTIDKIEPKQVQFNNPQTAADMLELSGSVYIQKSQMGGGSPVIRGFEANRVLLVVDGVRMNNAIYRSGHLQNAITIDQSILEETDIIYGPNSVIYGSDALGGVVDFKTKKPKFRSKTDTINKNSANAYGRFATVNQERTMHFDFNLGWEKFASMTSVTFSAFNDLHMGAVQDRDYPDFGVVKYYADRIDDRDTMLRKEDYTEQVGTGYHQTDLLQKFSYKLSKKVLLNLNTQYSTSSDIPRYDQLSELDANNQATWIEWNYGPQNRLLTSLGAQIQSENKFFNKVSLLGHFQKIDEDRITRRFQDSLRTTREEDVSVMGVNFDFIKDDNPKSQWYYGIEILHNIVESSAYAEDIFTQTRYAASTRYPDGGSTLSSAAAYVSYKNNFSEKATYSLGARYNYSVLNSTFNDTAFIQLPFNEITNNNSAATGSAGISYHPNKKFKIHTNFSTGFRRPNVDDFGKVFAKRDYVMVPNDQLKPEIAYNGELGITKSFGDDQLILHAVGFYTLLQDAIVRDFYTLNGQDSLDYDGEKYRIQTNVNATEAVIYGVSTKLFIKFNKEFSLQSSFNYTVGTNTSLDVPLGHIPPIYGRTDLIVNSDPFTIAVYVKHQAWKWRADYSPFGEDNFELATINGTPAWQTYNMRVAVQLTKSFQLQAAIENMLDIHYRPFASGVSGPGRNFVFTLRADI